MMANARWTGAAAWTLAALLVFGGGPLLLPFSAEAQGLGRIVGGAVGGSVLRSGTALGSDRRFVVTRPRLAIAEERRVGAVTQLAFDQDLSLLFVVLAEGGVRWWDLDRGLERGAVREAGIVSGLVRGGGLATEIITVRDDGSLMRLHPDGTRYPLSEGIPGFDGDGQSLVVTAAGTRAFRMRDGTWWIRTRDGDQWALPDAANDALPVFSAGGYRVAYRTDEGLTVRVLDFRSRHLEPVGRLSGCSNSTRITVVRFTPAGGRIVLGDASGNFCLWDMTDAAGPRRLFSMRTRLSGPVQLLTIDRDGGRVALGNGRQRVEVWPISGRIERVSSITLPMRSVGALAIDTARGWLLAGGENGTVAIHDVDERDDDQRSRPIARLISTNDGWSVLDRSGRFDGSQNGIDALRWAGETQEDDDARELSVDSFSESHYEPGLLAKIDAPASVLLSETAPDLPESGYVRPADVVIELGDQDATGYVPVVVRTEAGYPAEDVAGLRLYHNGKLVLDGEGKATLETRLLLVPGENLIRAVAVGRHGIEGSPTTQTATVPGQLLPANLNVIAIGVNDYALPKWELFRSLDDAKAVVSALREGGTRSGGERSSPIFGEVHAEILLDREAGKDAIEKLISRSGPAAQDVLLIYFSGHGYALQEEHGWDWYLLPHTREWRRGTVSEEELIRRHGLSARHLMTLLTRTAAQRVFLILDSCFSGAVVKTVEGIDAPEPQVGDDAATQKVLRQVARIGGFHVLAASRAHEEAEELQIEPHGALTYLVLEAMRGVADTDTDESISVREIIDYASAEMPDLADRLSQQPLSQRPVGYSRGVDFVVAGLHD